MSLIAFLGAIETGFIFALVGLGVFISFRVLNFPDLTVDGSLPLGAAASASLIVAGFDPYSATAIAMLAGAGAGLVTAWLNQALRVLHLLASILTMIALYSINLRVMGRPNQPLLGERTMLSDIEPLGLGPYGSVAVTALVAAAAVALLALFLTSEIGLAMRATGANPRMARAQGVRTGAMTYVGLALANALVALAGALFAQIQGGADISMGIGVIVVGLAAVILGEATLPARAVLWALVGCVLGSLVYRLAVAAALQANVLGLQAQDLKLLTAVLVAAAMLAPLLRERWAAAWAGRR
ncbi:MAG: ABC transporter permease [Alphaproteobacteria bacterium]|nr:ABC transporter permease [Alphaproteobacteria bacterium]